MSRRIWIINLADHTLVTKPRHSRSANDACSTHGMSQSNGQNKSIGNSTRVASAVPSGRCKSVEFADTRQLVDICASARRLLLGTTRKYPLAFERLLTAAVYTFIGSSRAAGLGGCDEFDFYTGG